jgi:hypothetical protein
MKIETLAGAKCLATDHRDTSLLISWEYPESAITASIFELQNN